MDAEVSITILLLLIFLILLMLAVSVLFCLTLYRVLGSVPERNQQFPRWFVWLFLVPWVGLIFQWIMLPFGIPNALIKSFPDNMDIESKANQLFKLGLAQVILMSVGYFASTIAAILIGTAGAVCWTLYWMKISKFKTQYLQNPNVKNEQ